MHTHPDQPHFVRCPKCAAKQKAREDALADMEKDLKSQFTEQEEECCKTEEDSQKWN